MRWSAGCPLPASSSGPGAGIRLSRHHRHPTLPSTCPANPGWPPLSEEWATAWPESMSTKAHLAELRERSGTDWPQRLCKQSEQL